MTHYETKEQKAARSLIEELDSLKMITTTIDDCHWWENRFRLGLIFGKLEAFSQVLRETMDIKTPEEIEKSEARIPR